MLGRPRKVEKTEQLIDSILNAQKADVLVVSGQDCKVCYANASALARMDKTDSGGLSCKVTYAVRFKNMCETCPLGANKDETLKNHTFETLHEDGRQFSVTCSSIIWTDNKPAVIFYYNDVDTARRTSMRLHELAYIDQLTGIPNRRKFLEDFNAVAEQINNGGFSGVMAMFDLDNFKAVNDTYGHNTGDIMLKRLVEHVQANADLAGHIYRIGGDEFLLFFTEKTGERDDLRAHYEELLASALQSYSMPSIEISCTVSMGVVLFPLHGKSVSELMRKADIALYAAKSAGRNRIVVFEDQYDSAKKFVDLYVNLFPVLTAKGNTFAYELIDKSEQEADPDKDVVLLKDYDRTLDLVGLEAFQSDTKYFISFNKQLLLPSVIGSIPKEKFIIQTPYALAEKPAGQELLKQLKARGYTLAIDDFPPVKDAVPRLELADIFKINFAGWMGYEQKMFIAAQPQKLFVAKGIDTMELLGRAKRAGYKLFQGVFFSHPIVKKTKDIEPLRANYLRLLRLCSTDDYVDFKEISNIIASDVALSFKLLKLLNSAAIGLRYKISSVEMGVSYLGEDHLKKWVGLLALRGVSAGQPLEIIRLSLIRARFGEELADLFSPRKDAKHLFLLGLLSLLDVAMERPFEEVLQEVSVCEDIQQSLLKKDGVYSDFLVFYRSYEYGMWDEVSQFAAKNNINSQDIYDAYLAAVKWYNALIAEL